MTELFIILFIFLIGLYSTSPVKNCFGIVERYGISFSIGLGVTSTALIITLAFLSGKSLALVLLSIFANTMFIIFSLRIFLSVKFEIVNFKEQFPKKGMAPGVIGFLFILSLIFSCYFPVTVPDGINYYDGIGFYFAQFRALPESLSKHHIAYPVHRTMLIQTLHGLIYMLGGEHPKIIYSFIYLSLLAVFFGRLLAFTMNPQRSVLFTALVASSPLIWFHSFISLTNVAATLGYFGGVAYWVSSKSNEKNHEIFSRISGYFFAFAVWARLEFILFILPVIFWTVIKEKNKENPGLIWNLFLPTIILIGGWEIFVRTYWGVEVIETNISFLAVALLIVIFLLQHKLQQVWKKSLITLSSFYSKSRQLLSNFHLALSIFLSLVFLGYLYYWKHLPPVLKIFGPTLLATILFHLIWVFTSLLLLRIPRLKGRLGNIDQDLLWILVTYFFATTAILTISSSHDIDRAMHILIPDFNRLLSFLGSFFNATNNRYLILVFVIWAFLFGCHKKCWGDNAWDKRLVKGMVLGNLIVCIIVFGISRMAFIVNHPFASQKEIRVSKGTFDLPNIDYYRLSWKLLYLLTDITQKNESIDIAIDDVSLTILERLAPRRWKTVNKRLNKNFNNPAKVIVLPKKKWLENTKIGSIIGEVVEQDWVVVRRSTI